MCVKDQSCAEALHGWTLGLTGIETLTARYACNLEASCFAVRGRDLRWATGTCVREARFSKEGRIFQRVATSLRVIPGATRAVMRGRGR